MDEIFKDMLEIKLVYEYIISDNVLDLFDIAIEHMDSHFDKQKYDDQQTFDEKCEI